MFDKALRKSVDPHLQPGEELLQLLLVQGKGAGNALFFGAVGGAAASMSAASKRDKHESAAAAAADPVGVKLEKKMALALTSQRLLIFKAGGAVTVKAQELITDVPIADVDSIEVGKGTLSKPITLTVRGASFTVETPKATSTGDLAPSLARAKGLTTA